MTTKNKNINLYLFKTVSTTFKHFIIPLVILALLFVKTVNAQDRVITLNEAIKLGVESSNVVKLSRAKIDQAISVYEQAKDMANPTGKASFGYDRAEIPYNTLKLGSTNFGLPKNNNAYLGTASLNEVILGANKLKYAQKSTELLTQVARLDAENDKDEITYDIINAYYTLYKVLQSKKVVDQNLKTIDEQIHQAQRFFEQGLVTKNDVLRFQLQRSNIELNGIDLETNRKIVNYNMDIMLGLPETTQLVINEINADQRQISPLSNYIDTALASRVEVRQLDLRGEVAETNIKNVKANTLPTLGASASAYYIGIAANPIPQTGSFITPVTVGLSLSWDFSSLWNNKNKVSEAKIQRQEVEFSKSIKINDVKKDVNQNYQNYLMALDKIKLLQISIEQAGENNKILDSKYRNNIASATDRADAETLLYQAQINLELAKADAGLAYYTLIKSTGKLNK
jgi:outer membrane protein TolC